MGDYKKRILEQQLSEYSAFPKLSSSENSVTEASISSTHFDNNEKNEAAREVVKEGAGDMSSGSSVIPKLKKRQTGSGKCVYLEHEVNEYLDALSKQTGFKTSQLINAILKEYIKDNPL